MLKYSSKNVESNLGLMDFIDTLIIHLPEVIHGSPRGPAPTSAAAVGCPPRRAKPEHGVAPWSGHRVPSPAGQAGTWRRSLEPWTSSAGDPALRLPALPHRTHPGIHGVASCLMPRRLGVTRGEP